MSRRGLFFNVVLLWLCVGFLTGDVFQPLASSSAQNTAVVDPPAPMENVYELVTDGRGECFLHEPVMEGERVSLSIVYRGVGDEGVPSSIDVSYPLVVWYNFDKVVRDRMRKKIFDYGTTDISVDDGVIHATFTIPEDIVTLSLRFSVQVTGGSLYYETADRDWATLQDILDDKTQAIQVKMLVKS